MITNATYFNLINDADCCRGIPVYTRREWSSLFGIVKHYRVVIKMSRRGISLAIQIQRFVAPLLFAVDSDYLFRTHSCAWPAILLCRDKHGSLTGRKRDITLCKIKKGKKKRIKKKGQISMWRLITALIIIVFRNHFYLF